MRKFLSCMIVVVALVAALAPGSLSAQAPIDAQVLVWDMNEGLDDGKLELMSTAGDVGVLVDFGGGVFDRVVKRCGQDYWMPGGQAAALFTGPASGELAIYPFDGAAPVALGTTSRMACAGPETFQFSPDGQRVAYINFEYDVLDKEYPAGDLVVADAATGTMQNSFDWATGFKLYDDGVMVLRLFPDGKGYATEGDLDWWDGTARRTLVTLEPVYPPDTEDVDCGLTSGSVARIGDTAYALVGQKCETGAANWTVYSVPMSGGAATQVIQGVPAGSFFSGSFTTQIVPALDGSGFLIAVPSGLTRNTVALAWVALDGSSSVILEGQHILADRYGERLTEGRHMQVTMDGSALAFVTTTPNQDQSLWMLDLSTINTAPVLVEEAGAGGRIFQYLWSAENELFFAAGSVESSALKMATVAGGTQRLERGRFFRIAISYTGDKIAAAEWYDNPNSIGDDLFKLTMMTPDGISFMLKEGGEGYDEYIPLAIK